MIEIPTELSTELPKAIWAVQKCKHDLDESNPSRWTSRRLDGLRRRKARRSQTHRGIPEGLVFTRD